MHKMGLLNTVSCFSALPDGLKKIPGLCVRPGMEMECFKSVLQNPAAADSVFAVQAQNVSTSFGRQLNFTDCHR